MNIACGGGNKWSTHSDRKHQQESESVRAIQANRCVSCERRELFIGILLFASVFHEMPDRINNEPELSICKLFSNTVTDNTCCHSTFEWLHICPVNSSKHSSSCQSSAYIFFASLACRFCFICSTPRSSIFHCSARSLLRVTTTINSPFAWSLSLASFNFILSFRLRASAKMNLVRWPGVQHGILHVHSPKHTRVSVPCTCVARCVHIHSRYK